MGKVLANIGYIGTDGRSFWAALQTSKAKSEVYPGEYQGWVVRGTPGMRGWAQKMDLPVKFIDTENNSVESYAQSLIGAFESSLLDVVMVLPESLLFNGLVDLLDEAGFAGRIIGLDKNSAFIEADKIACKQLCGNLGIPVAPVWVKTDAKDYGKVRGICLDLIHEYGGVVLKYPYSAGGKGARIILDAWAIEKVYGGLISDYKDDYVRQFGGQGEWPLLIEARMSGVEISFTILVDIKGNYAILPTAMDYPERFEGLPGINNPITGGMGAISPHPLESPELMEMAAIRIAEPLVNWLKESKGLIRPCVFYPGCFVSFEDNFKPRDIRVCEINIRPGEPEFQPVMARLRNPGPLLSGMVQGKLDKVRPEVRKNQLSICMALVTGPGGPKQQKGYPWSLTKGENLEIDFEYFRKRMGLVPSAMEYDGQSFKTGGSRVAYLISSASFDETRTPDSAAEQLRLKMLNAFDLGKIRAVPRENPQGNRLDLRRDIGSHFSKAKELKK